MTLLDTMMFSCPTCSASLQKNGGQYECARCSRSFPIIDGIPIFTRAQPYYGEIQNDQMRRLIEDTKVRGYKQALREHLDNDFVYTYASDERRAMWMELLPLHQASTVLDAGCGWGTNTIPISRQVRQIVALDATYERVKFVEIRAEQTQARNVIPVVASATELPFPSGQFDLVAFNGVLEWLGASDHTMDPGVCQMKALEEAHKVLKPGGLIYLGIENRYSLRYFLGEQDDHSFLRFTSLMPRWLADAYCRLRTGERYSTYTHSLGTYRRMLTDAGFVRLQSHYPWPNYRNPDVIVPLTRAKILGLLSGLQRSARSRRKWLYLSMLYAVTALEGAGRACHSFCFVAQKS